MKKSQVIAFYAGIVLFAAGLLCAIIFRDAESALAKLPAVIIATGTGMICVGISLITRFMNPKLAKEYEINEKDERNIRLREKAGLFTWGVTQFVLMAMVLVFLLLDFTVLCWIAYGALAIHNSSLFLGIAIHNRKI